MESGVCRIENTSEIDFPDSLSFFSPYLPYYVKQILGVGGEAFLSRSYDGAVSGLFIYDESERAGTIFTQSREVFDYFYHLKPFNSLFAELKTEHDNECFDIYNVNLENRVIDHRFNHEITIAESTDIGTVERFMALTHPGINRSWVKIALSDGEKCFTVKLGDEIAGLGWLSVVHQIGRLHSLYVKPQFRRIGIGRDIFYARLLWLKSTHAHSVFSEISRENKPSSKIAVKGGMSASGQVFQYYKMDAKAETIASTAQKSSKF